MSATQPSPRCVPLARLANTTEGTMTTATRVVTMDDVKPSLEEAQAIVGGYVQLLELPNGSQMLIDEDGISKGLPMNVEASMMTHGLYLGSILGDVLILSGNACWRD